MDFIDFTPLANPSGFPSVSASTANPKTLHHAHHDITYVNTGGGWTPLCQASSGSVYSGYTALDSATKSNVLANLATPSPSGFHATKNVKTAEVLVRGR